MFAITAIFMKKKKFRHSDIIVPLQIPKNLRVQRMDIPHINAADANTDIPKSKICLDITVALQILKILRVRKMDIPRISAIAANTDIRKSKICSVMK